MRESIGKQSKINKSTLYEMVTTMLTKDSGLCFRNDELSNFYSEILNNILNFFHFQRLCYPLSLFKQIIP